MNCALGIHQIGAVMMCFGAMTALSALFIGAISRHIKRLAIMTSGTLFNTGLLIVLLWWKPRHDDLPMFYVIASCLGLCDAIWQTQTNSKLAFLNFISILQNKAYIPLRRKQSCVGPWRWLSPPTPLFCVADTNMLVSENAKICVSPDTKHKICVFPRLKTLRPASGI